MSTTDTRGFSYPLQAVMLRRQWAIDRIQGQMAAARAACADLEQARAETLEACEAQSMQAAGAWTVAPDPTAHQRMLGYLARLREKAFTLQARIHEYRQAIGNMERLLTQEQVRLATLEKHRDDLRGDYVLGQKRAAQADADSQWLTLSSWRERSGA